MDIIHFSNTFEMYGIILVKSDVSKITAILLFSIKSVTSINKMKTISVISKFENIRIFLIKLLTKNYTKEIE